MPDPITPLRADERCPMCGSRLFVTSRNQAACASASCAWVEPKQGPRPWLQQAGADDQAAGRAKKKVR